MKAFVDDQKKKANLKSNSEFRWIENIVEKGENAGYQHCLLFQQCFQKPSFSGFKIRMCGKELTHSHTITPFG